MKNQILALLHDRPDDIEWSVLDLNHPAVKWIKTYHETYSSLPAVGLFAQECLDEGEDTRAIAPWDYYVKEARDVRFVEEAVQYLDVFNKKYANDPKQAILALRDTLAKLNEPLASVMPVDIAATTKERWEKFAQRQAARIKTGILPFDEASGGISPDDEFMILSARLGIGKALKYGTGVLVPSGDFVPVESVNVGDELVGLNGKPTKVIGVRDFKTLAMYRVSFIDGTTIDCCEDHLWTVRIDGELHTKTTKELLCGKIGWKGTTDTNKGHNYYHYYLPQIEPIDFDEQSFIIPPYTMGVLLGDGSLSTRSLRFTNADLDVVAAVENELPNELTLKELKGKFEYSIKQKKILFKGLHNPSKNIYVEELVQLSLLGKRSWEKHIPKQYLRSSVRQRLELLAGIIDTDGYVPKQGGTIQIALTSEQLIADIQWLVESLGGYARCKPAVPGSYKKEGETIQCRNVYSMTIVLPCDLQLKGKKREIYKRPKYDRTRPIVAIDKIEDCGGRCFIVNAKDHLFITEHFVPTHNSFILHYVALEIAKQGLNVGIYSGEMSEIEVGARIDSWLTHVSNFALTRGKLRDHSTQEAAYAEKVKGRLLVLTPEKLGRNATPSDLRKFIKEHNLSVLLIDQLSLMQPDGRQNSEAHERYSNLSLQLKSLQQERRIPIIAVSQLNRSAQEQEITAANISGSDRIGQDATLILALKRKEGELIIEVTKARSFKRPDKGWAFTWDIDTGVLTPQTTALDAIQARKASAKKADEEAAKESGAPAEYGRDDDEDEDYG